MIFEPNDTIGQAPLLAENTYDIQGVGQDWFKLDVRGPGSMTLTMTPTNNIDMHMVLYQIGSGGNAEAIAQTHAPGSSPETITFNATGFQYYINVFSENLTLNGGNYRLALDLPNDIWPAPANEPNDTLETATRITGGTPYHVAGTGYDYYRISVDPGVLKFEATPAANTSVNIELLNSAGQVVQASQVQDTVNDGKTTVTHIAGAKEDYFLRIYNPANAGFGKTYYDLTATVPTGSWSNTFNFGAAGSGSVAVYDIDNDGQDEIFIGTLKKLDASHNEILPAGLLCLEADGTLKWSMSLPGLSTPDPMTGKMYSSTSITTAPVFSDVDGDGQIDIVVGAGGNEHGVMVNGQMQGGDSQPGDRSGIYVISNTGQLKWMRDSGDTFGGNNGGPNGRNDGVRGAPVVFDLDSDGVREIIYTSWDQKVTVLDGRTGELERRINFHDTIGSSPRIVDLNRDGLYEVVVGADVTSTSQSNLIPFSGGILHAVTAYFQPNVAGWNTQIGNTTEAEYRGFHYDQSLWSTPQAVDLDLDGTQEIVYGTGNNFKGGQGHFVDVRNADGSLRFRLNTDGYTVASPLIADLDGDGRSEIIQATTGGRVYAWNWQGNLIFNTGVTSIGHTAPTMLTSPVAVDLNGDNRLEIIVQAAPQTIILNSNGTQYTPSNAVVQHTGAFYGTPVVRDIDNDGRVDLINAGDPNNTGQLTVNRWVNPFGTVASSYRDAGYQNHQNLDNIQDFVGRFYASILGRAADAGGENGWTDSLYTGTNSGADVARGFIFSPEFVNRNTDNDTFVRTLYQAFFNRAADQGGLDAWKGNLDRGSSRGDVLNGFIFSQEFANLCGAYGIRPAPSFGPDAGPGDNALNGSGDADILLAGAGNDVIRDVGPISEANTDRNYFGQVYRLYGAIFGREPDSAGFLAHVDLLAGGMSVNTMASSMTLSAEFQQKYGSASNEQFITLMYANVLGRAPDAGGLAGWLAELNAGKSRGEVVLGFSESGEFVNRTNAGLDQRVRLLDLKLNDVIEGGAGDDNMAGGRGADTYIFRSSAVGSDTILGFEAWDELQLSGFGYRTGADARAKMVQQGGDVIFADRGEQIIFKNFTLGEMNRVRFNVS